MIGIYKITSPTKRVYIGQSVDIKRRLADYKGGFSCNQPRLYNSIKKYGFKKHKFEVVTECEISDLNKWERYYQDMYSAIGPHGLNCLLTSAGDRKLVHSEETRAKMRKNRLGKLHNDGTKAKMSAASIGIKKTKEHCINISKAHKGRVHTESARNNMNAARLRGEKHQYFGKKRDASYIEKVSGSNNYLSKTVFNTRTGIYYDTMSDAAASIGWMRERLKNQVAGITKVNTTPFIFA